MVKELSDFLKELTPAQRESFARKVKTSVGYLYQIAGGHRLAGHELAKRLEKESAGRVPKSKSRPDIFDEVSFSSLLKEART